MIKLSSSKPKSQNATLESLENDLWPAPDYPSQVVTECHRLRSVPISDFGIEELRLLISQGIGLQTLLPIALEKLSTDRYLEGNFFKGDLLLAVVKQHQFITEESCDLVQMLQSICIGVKSDPNNPLSKAQMKPVLEISS